jgi:glycosyltransferase involved in cell wall biosynthesis
VRPEPFTLARVDARQLLDGLSVVVPVFNEAAVLTLFVERLESVLAELDQPYEILLVDDGSTDMICARLLDEQSREPRVRTIHLLRNRGQHNALLAGIRAARFTTVLTLDADLQNPPEEIPQLLAKLDEGFDVVYGTPDHERHGFLRDVASRTTKLALQSAMGAATARKVSAFRAFRTEIREAFEDYRSPYVNIDVLLTWGATRFGAVSVSHQPRAGGTSKYGPYSLFTHAFNMVTGFTVIPLQLASLTGFAFTLFGFAVLTYVLAKFFFEGRAEPGFPFLASIIAIFSGAQLFALGIVGEYLARMHFRLMDRPPYTVRPGERALMSQAPPMSASKTSRTARTTRQTVLVE